MLGGAEAKSALEALEAQQKVRHVASSYTIARLGTTAELVPEAFVHQADRQGLKSSSNAVERLLARDLSTVVRTLSENMTVRGAMAIDSGMLIDRAGDLPGLGEEEQLASELHEMMSGMGHRSMHEGWGMSASHWTLHTENGALLLAQSGEISIAAWTEKDANHAPPIVHLHRTRRRPHRCRRTRLKTARGFRPPRGAWRPRCGAFHVESRHAGRSDRSPSIRFSSKAVKHPVAGVCRPLGPFVRDE